MGANSLCRAKGYFGEFFRRMRAKLGTAQAITATAHKIARILYHVLSTKEPYSETVFHHCDEQAQRRAEMRLRKQDVGSRLIAHMGFSNNLQRRRSSALDVRVPFRQCSERLISFAQIRVAER
jgi:hypothetical protein